MMCDFIADWRLQIADLCASDIVVIVLKLNKVITVAVCDATKA
jgi:hypothetical protein